MSKHELIGQNFCGPEMARALIERGFPQDQSACYLRPVNPDPEIEEKDQDYDPWFVSVLRGNVDRRQATIGKWMAAPSLEEIIRRFSERANITYDEAVRDFMGWIDTGIPFDHLCDRAAQWYCAYFAE